MDFWLGGLTATGASAPSRHARARALIQSRLFRAQLGIWAGRRDRKIHITFQNYMNYSPSKPCPGRGRSPRLPADGPRPVGDEFGQTRSYRSTFTHLRRRSHDRLDAQRVIARGRLEMQPNRIACPKAEKDSLATQQHCQGKCASYSCTGP